MSSIGAHQHSCLAGETKSYDIRFIERCKNNCTKSRLGIWKGLSLGNGEAEGTGTVRASDARYSRDMRRHELAWQLVGFDARTRTIQRWTGLSGYRIRALYRAYAEGEPAVSGSPLRGVPPTQVKCEAAVLAGLLRAFDVLPAPSNEVNPDSLPSLARGERLCRAYRAYREFRALAPETEITIEYAMLLLTELVRRVQMTLGRCPTCQIPILVDRLSIATPRCAHCAHEAQAGLPYAPVVVTPNSKEESVGESTNEVDEWMPGTQGRFFENLSADSIVDGARAVRREFGSEADGSAPSGYPPAVRVG